MLDRVQTTSALARANFMKRWDPQGDESLRRRVHLAPDCYQANGLTFVRYVNRKGGACPYLDRYGPGN
jgi:hypothetical protein